MKTYKNFGISIGVMVFLFFLLIFSFLFAANGIINNTLDFTGWDRMLFAHRDPFYVGATTDNWYHIPIIEPYYLIKNPGDTGIWNVNLEGDYLHDENNALHNYSLITDVKKFAVENEVLLFYTPFIVPDYKILHWFVIIPNQKLEIGFEKEKDFQNYIQKQGIQDPRWITPDDAIHQFWETGCLYWIPDCEK